MDSAGYAVVLSHVPSIPLVLFISRSLFLFRFSFFWKPIGVQGRADADGCPFQMESGPDRLDDPRWDTASLHWPKKKDARSAARHLFSSTRRLSVCQCVCVRWHGMSHIGRSVGMAGWLAGWLGWHNRSRRASIHQSRIPSLRFSISPIPSSSIYLSLFFNQKATSTYRRDHCLATLPYASDDSTAHCYPPLFQSRPRMAARLLIHQQQIRTCF
ncbi:hypothetical protein QR685DRAFT_531278 [Neurospora intermedia]|uniref:Uncharacterized protein n=1 Tax=Neurospora intermedia TaxID=5142 RepID=A0ABR3D7E1_NEUIN